MLGKNLRSSLTESIDDKLKGMALLKGKLGVGFDVCT
jgi:ATP-dependent RNA helicase DDX21